MSPARASVQHGIEQAYRGKRVLVTGHTGFKGGWLTLWLRELGAEVTGFALAPEPKSIFLTADVAQACTHVVGDVRNLEAVREALDRADPDIVFHLAAQPLVRLSYEQPLETLSANVMGTAHVLEAVRRRQRPCAVVIVSSDKCYENREWLYGYREDDPMGGHDVYSMSKGATELVTASWRRSFFPIETYASHRVGLASARAGNVIGGGDWAKDRIVPDAIGALSAGRDIAVRNPAATRPWQHVLEPLGGYLLLGSKLLSDAAPGFCEAFNFGPSADATQPVRVLADALVSAWGSGAWADHSTPGAVHEATLLKLAIDKAQGKLGWRPRWSFETAVAKTVAWYRAQADGASTQALQALCRSQIADYLSARSG